MSKTISEIYTEYKIMPNLQQHMLRVASVASLICENFNEPLPKEEIITACLLHDMGNIIKSRFEFLPEFLQPEGIEYWQKIKDDYIKKYGNDEHKATISIMRELGLSHQIVSIVDQIKFSFLCSQRDGDDFKIKIVHYSDARVDPYGVVTFEERMEEGKKRYKNSKTDFGGVSESERQKLVVCGKEIEKQIFEKCRINFEDINNDTIAPLVSELRNFVIK